MKPEEALDQITYLRELVSQSRVRVAGWWSYFIVWGVLWIAGYLGTLWLPQPYNEWTWPVVYALGFGRSFWQSARHGRGQPTPALLKKLGWVSWILLGAGLSLGWLFPLDMGRHTVNALFPFWVGLVYVVNGIFLGRELVWIGAWVAAAAVGSLWLPAPVQDYFLAAVGGGGLVVTGTFLRRQVKAR
jgi:hypothetical protein